MNTTEAQRAEYRARGIMLDLLDDIDTLRAALRRLADSHKSANGPCMTADDACPCAQCEAGRIDE